jgi:hypothetical protein
MTSAESPFFDIPRAEWIASNRSAFAVWTPATPGFVGVTVASSGRRCAYSTSIRTKRADALSSSHRDRRAHNPLVAGSSPARPTVKGLFMAGYSVLGQLFGRVRRGAQRDGGGDFGELANSAHNQGAPPTADRRRS